MPKTGAMRYVVSCVMLGFGLVSVGCGESTEAPTDSDGGTPIEGADSGTPVMVDDAGGGGEPGVCEGDERRAPLVYYGTPEPTAMPLTPGQILAIGSWNGCTGTFITDEWVLTAEHCGIRPGRRFCVGEDPADPNVCFTAEQVQEHPDLDMAVVRMDAPASSRMPALEPIPINTEMLDDSRIGETLEAAGYGQQEDGRSGEREFTAEPLVAYERGGFLVIDGMGERGVCFGDSGGPVMIIASDGSVRVAGDLSYGDPSCVGRDRYSRTDLAVDWIEGFVGPTVVEGGGCGSVDAAAACTTRCTTCAPNYHAVGPASHHYEFIRSPLGTGCAAGSEPVEMALALVTTASTLTLSALAKRPTRAASSCTRPSVSVRATCARGSRSTSRLRRRSTWRCGWSSTSTSRCRGPR